MRAFAALAALDEGLPWLKQTIITKTCRHLWWGDFLRQLFACFVFGNIAINIQSHQRSGLLSANEKVGLVALGRAGSSIVKCRAMSMLIGFGHQRAGKWALAAEIWLFWSDITYKLPWVSNKASQFRSRLDLKGCVSSNMAAVSGCERNNIGWLGLPP